MTATCLAVVAFGLTSVGGRPASASDLPSVLTLVGHGWGHGRGMGQYGALGYANDGWSYQQILAHYYGGTTLGSVPSSTAVTVHLTELDGVSVTVSPMVAVSTPPGQTVYSNPGGDETVSGSNGFVRAYAGQIVVNTSGQVWNVVPLDTYVEGVVPREMPANWPATALEAQAVAARSYVLASAGSGGMICDTPACQVYGGDPAQYPGSLSSQSNAAVTATAGQVLFACGSDPVCGLLGQVALAQYSSSTGGYTAGGAFPAVADDGDSTPSNPNHTWYANIPTPAVQAAFPSVGTLQSVTVTQRNGLGDLGGRVLQMVLVGTAGRQAVTGDQLAGALGLKSDWFAITDTNPPPGSDTGYWVVGADGSVYPFGSAPSYGSMLGHPLAAPVIGMAPTGDGAGYWLVGGDGGIFSFGDARFFGSTGNLRLTAPVLGVASTADSNGYWLVATDGGIFSFGDARFFGSTGNLRLVRPIVAMARTGDGNGYWLVASDGGIFSFGDARFYGSASGLDLAAPIVGMVPTSDGRGYWLVAADGGIFAFGDAGFVGSLGGSGVTDAVSVSATPDGGGYVIVTRSGKVYSFGDATYYGDPATTVSGWSGKAIGIFARG
ncbi:MAG: SpoIID/LytB domain-containing protein [Acidimicrobiales bacterium]|nr:SpoIID/LytB domain-containing protein [Acidimicrobiales bacterium]